MYYFYGDSQSVPLYIGKSVNIRTRVMNHLRTAEEARLLAQTQSITHVRTAGDLGAQLLEAQQIKALQPLYNKKLRRVHRLCSMALDLAGVRFVYSNEPEFRTHHELYGLFGSKVRAVETLRKFADENNLCYVRLGIERPQGERPCFRYTIGRCGGVCCGKGDVLVHDQLLRGALESIHVMKWPYQGRIAIEERDEGGRQLHVIDHWRYCGSAGSLKDAKKLKLINAEFDRDDYYILAQPIRLGGVKVREL
ncbi:endonuclease [Pseudoxanthomonas sp. CCNWLW251]